MKRKTKNTFSIIICAKNEQQNIDRKIINSLEIQGEVIEIIIINDHSQDKTEQIIKKYQKKYPNIILINNKYQKGKAGALFSGVEKSRGKWLVLTDCDVIVDSKAIYVAYNHIKKNNVWVVGSRAINRNLFWEFFEIIRMKILPSWLARGQLMIVRNKKLLFKNIKFVDDVEIAFEAIRRNKKVVNCEQMSFTDSFQTGGNFYRQLWRRTVAMDKAIWKYWHMLFSDNYFNPFEIVKNIIFILIFIIIPIVISVFIMISIYFYWPIVFVCILCYPLTISCLILSTAIIYSYLTRHHSLNLNWEKQ